MSMTWQRFIGEYGGGIPGHYLAAIVEQPVAAVRKARAGAAIGSAHGTTRRAVAPAFVDLFTRWRGRAPQASDWPSPLRYGHGGYQWLPPEDELLASLVGRLGKPEIAQILTARLRTATGNATAERNIEAVQIRINKLGMQATDVVGGITVQQAGDEIGSLEIVRNAVRSGALATHRVGRLIVIPHEAWQRWKATRDIAPPGYIHLASLREPLGISSDSKLPEFASAGYIPTAIRCNPARPGVHNGRFGTWYIDPKVGRQLVADRRAGRPMPWHGKPLLGNLKHSHARWIARRCASGHGKGSWISIPTAGRWYDFSRQEIEQFIADGRVNGRHHNGKRLVMRQQLAELRQDIGYTEAQAADKVGVTVPALRELLQGVHWRQPGLIPLATVQAVIKRAHSQHGCTIAEAAAALPKPETWVQDRIKDGTIRVTRARWDRRRIYITAPMFERLKAAAQHDLAPKPELPSTWINLAAAARLAGVSATTVNAWRLAGDVRTKPATKVIGARFARVSIMTRARRYWKTCRYHRAPPPEWLRPELTGTPRGASAVSGALR